MDHFDAEQPAGTSLNPLGWKQESATSYLLGLSCGCGIRSLVVAAAFEGDDDLRCPRCGTSLR